MLLTYLNIHITELIGGGGGGGPLSFPAPLQVWAATKKTFTCGIPCTFINTELLMFKVKTKTLCDIKCVEKQNNNNNNNTGFVLLLEVLEKTWNFNSFNFLFGWEIIRIILK